MFHSNDGNIFFYNPSQDRKSVGNVHEALLERLTVAVAEIETILGRFQAPVQDLEHEEANGLFRVKTTGDQSGAVGESEVNGQPRNGVCEKGTPRRRDELDG
jgi:hypothetical protein